MAVLYVEFLFEKLHMIMRNEGKPSKYLIRFLTGLFVFAVVVHSLQFFLSSRPLTNWSKHSPSRVK